MQRLVFDPARMRERVTVMKWAIFLLLAILALFFAGMGACCVAFLIPQNYSKNGGFASGFGGIALVFLPLWLAGLFLAGREMIRLRRTNG
jgi:hypothetical protein